MGSDAVQNAIAVGALDALAIGVIVTDGHARRLYANAAADRLMSEPAGALRCCAAGKLSAACQESRSSLHTLIALACAGEATIPAGWTTGLAPGCGAPTSDGSFILVPAPDRGGPDLAVRVLPFSSPGPVPGTHDASTVDRAMNAIVLIRPIERDCNLEVEARRLLGLSRAESRLASRLATGLSLQEAAGAQDVTLSTARSHLKSIFRKTGLNRQSQLVALLRSAQIPVETTRRPVATHRASTKASTKTGKARLLDLSA